MRRLFYVLLTIPGISAMEKDKQQGSPTNQATISQEVAEEIMSQAFSTVIQANDLFDQAESEKRPDVFYGSKYEQAQKLYIHAFNLFLQARDKGNKEASIAAKLTYENKIVLTESRKAEINYISYSVSSAWIQLVKNQESIKIPSNSELAELPEFWFKIFNLKRLAESPLNPREYITLQQALKETKNKPLPPEKHKKEKK